MIDTNKVIDFILGGRFTELKFKDTTYIFDKLIFTVIISLLLCSSIYFLSSNGWDKSNHIYVKCSGDQPCDNSYYNNLQVCGKYLPIDSYLCTTKVLTPPYQYGNPEPAYITYFGGVAFIMCVVGLIINHFLFNKDKMKYVVEVLKDE